jgi:cytoskeletal protein RodZ
VEAFVLTTIGVTPVGRELAEARTRLGLPVEEISRRTKIKVHVLEAIERDDFAHVPKGLYARGLLRAYAHEVGIDGEALVRRFRLSAEEISDNEIIRFAAAQRETERMTATAPSEIRRLTSLTVLALLSSATIYVIRGNSAPSAPPAPAPVIATQAIATPAKEPAPPPVATAGTSPKPASLRVDMQPTAECWVSATADGQQVVYRLLNANEQTQVEAASAIGLRVGDPSAFAFTINGMPARVSGTAGEPVTVRITPDNYRDFLIH